jgi:hypothetical protein
VNFFLHARKYLHKKQHILSSSVIENSEETIGSSVLYQKGCRADQALHGLEGENAPSLSSLDRRQSRATKPPKDKYGHRRAWRNRGIPDEDCRSLSIRICCCAVGDLGRHLAEPAPLELGCGHTPPSQYPEDVSHNTIASAIETAWHPSER